MVNSHTDFWLDLFNQGESHDDQVRLWNGYLAWKLPNNVKDSIGLPAGTCVELTEDEKAALDTVAEAYDGHPRFSPTFPEYMDFAGYEFEAEANFDGRMLVNADFSHAKFSDVANFQQVQLISRCNFGNARFLGRAIFADAVAHGEADFGESWFHSKADFRGTQFLSGARFYSTWFTNVADFRNGIFEGPTTFAGAWFLYGADFDSASFSESATFDGASFGDTVRLNEGKFMDKANFARVDFQSRVECENVRFTNEAVFDDSTFGSTVRFDGTVFCDFAGFRRVEFHGPMLCRTVTFGQVSNFSETLFDDACIFRDTRFSHVATFWGSRFSNIVHFTNAVFTTTTSFRQAAFNAVPELFNASLYEDTDFTGIHWEHAEAGYSQPQGGQDVDGAIRAWERLELLMSQLEKPYERHQFYRLKMRARRRVDPWLVKTFNWTFEKTSDYGWGVGRTFVLWSVHWIFASLVLFVNAGLSSSFLDWPELVFASLGTGFANAHPILHFTSTDGYLFEGKALLESCGSFCMLGAETLCVLNMVGVLEAIIGSVLLFLLLLALRNRFRLR